MYEKTKENVMKHIALVSLSSILSFYLLPMDRPNKPLSEHHKPVKSLKQEAPDTIFKSCVAEKTIENTWNNRTFGVQALLSPNGKYFIENISTHDEKKPQIKIRQLPNCQIIETFESYANKWQFDPHSRYVLFHTETKNGCNRIPAFLYSLKTKKTLPLCNKNLVCADLKLTMSSNGQYIAYHFMPIERNKDTIRFLAYNDYSTTISEDLLMKNMKISNVWTFCSDGKDTSGDQHLIYISEDKSALIKIKLPYHVFIPCCLDPKKNYTNIYATESLITLQRDKAIDLFTMNSDTIVPLRTISTDIYDSNIINIVSLPMQLVIAHQYTKNSFAILEHSYNRKYKEIASYTFKNDRFPETYVSLTKLVTNKSCRNLVALYRYNTTASPSSIVFCDLPSVNSDMQPIRKDFQEEIHSIEFIDNKHILIGGIKAYVFDTQGNKIGSLGQCQIAVAHGNSIIKIRHTPFFGYDLTLDGHKEIPMKTKLSLVNIDEEKLSS